MNIIRRIINKASSLLWFFLRFFAPIKRNRIIANNFFGEGFGDVPMLLYRELLKKGGFDLYWVVRDEKTALPQGIKPVRIQSWKEKWIMATSKMRISNIRNYFPVRLKKGQFYLQTWHGGLGFKLVEAEIEDRLSKHYVKWAKYDGKICSGFIPPFPDREEYFRRTFWLNPKCDYLDFGSYPREDFFDRVDKQALSSVFYDKYGLKKDRSLILYAPTFRDNGDLSLFRLDFASIVRAFEKKTGRECYIIVRLHPNDLKKDCGICFSEKVIDGSIFENSQELVAVSDYLISDYSSIIFDFLKLEKSFFFYVPDERKYRQERGINSYYDSLDQKKNRDITELLDNIETIDFEKEKELIRAEKKRFGLTARTGACSKIAKWIVDKCLGAD